MQRTTKMSRKQQRQADPDFWDHITLMVPRNFEAAAREAAHRFSMPVTEYCRRALLLRLEADGIRLADYRGAPR